MQGIFGKLSPTKMDKSFEKFETAFKLVLEEEEKTLWKFAVFSWPIIDRIMWKIFQEILSFGIASPPPLFENFPKNHPFW